MWAVFTNRNSQSSLQLYIFQVIFPSSGWYWVNTIQSMSQIRPNTRLKASKTPKWRIWVPYFKGIYPWVNIWKPASKHPGLKSCLKFKFWTWSVTKKWLPKNTSFCPNKKSMTVWENYAIAMRKCEIKDIKFSQVRTKILALGWYWVTKIFFWPNKS